MKILFFTENNHSGGLDSFLVYLINHWPDSDDQFTVVCNASHPGLTVLRSRLKRPCRIVAHAIPMHWEWMNKFASIPVLGRLAKLVSLISRYPFFLFYIVAIRRLLLTEAPDRVMIVNGGYPAGDSNRAAAIAWGMVRGARPKSVHNFHNFATPPRIWERLPEAIIDRAVAANTLAFVSVSEVCATSLENRPAAANAPVTHIHNGIPDPDPSPIDSCQVKRSLDLPGDAPLCLMLGTYEPRKGHDFLMRAFGQVLLTHPQAKLVVCGYGSDSYRQGVRQLVESLGISHSVRLFGFRDDVADLIKAADVVLVPSQAFESFGFMIVEAMSLMTPVVATRVGGIPEVLGNDEGGFLVDQNDVKAFAEQTSLLLGNAEIRKKMGAEGHHRFIQNFTARRMAGEYKLLIKQPAQSI